MATQVLLIGAILPVVLILLWTMRRDRLPEPPKVVLITFLLGALSTIPILIVNVVLVAGFGFPEEPTTLADALLISFVSAALVEEAFKFAVLYGYSAQHDAFDEPYDGIVYGVSASLGFAFVENLLYVFVYSETFGEQLLTAALRAVLAIPLHANCGAIMGFCIGIARFSRGGQRLGWIVAGLLGAIALHGVYDAFLFGGAIPEAVERGLDWLGSVGAIVVAATGAACAALAAARLRRDQLRWRLLAQLDASTTAQPATPQPMHPATITATHPPTPPPAASTPTLPLCALATSAFAGILIVTGLALAVLGGAENAAEDAPIFDLAGAASLGAIATAALGLVLSIAALVLRKPWIPASIVGLLVSGLILGICLVILVIGIVADS